MASSSNNQQYKHINYQNYNQYDQNINHNVNNNQSYSIKNNKNQSLLLPIQKIRDTYNFLIEKNMLYLQSLHDKFLDAVEQNNFDKVSKLIDHVDVNYRPLYYNNNGDLQILDANGKIIDIMPITMNISFNGKDCKYHENVKVIHNNGGIIFGESALKLNSMNVYDSNIYLTDNSNDDSVRIFNLLINKRVGDIFQLNPNLISFDNIDIIRFAGVDDPKYMESLFNIGLDAKIQNIIHDESTDTDIYMENALHKAVLDGSPAVLKLLLSKGADPNIIDQFKRSPLMILIEYSNDKYFMDKFVTLLAYKADPNYESCHGSIINMFLDINKEAFENYSNTIDNLMMIYNMQVKPKDIYTDIKFTKFDMFKLLVHYGADVKRAFNLNVYDNKGGYKLIKITPLDYALNLIENVTLEYGYEYQQLKLIIDFLKPMTKLPGLLRNITIDKTNYINDIKPNYPKQLLQKISPGSDVSRRQKYQMLINK